jgi:fucose permease
MTSRAAPRALILLAFLAFISLGLPDTLIGVAWSSIRAHFDRPISHLGFLLVCGTCGYLLSSFCSGIIVNRIGVGRLLVVSCAIVTTSLSLYAFSPAFLLLLPAAFLGGIGAGAIDGGMNHFGAHAFTPRVLNWLHACWGIGATSGPIIMTSVLASRASYSVGYAIVAATMLMLTLAFLFTVNAWKLEESPGETSEPEQPHATLLEALSNRIVVSQVLFYFVYGGVEASAGCWVFTLLTESRGTSIAAAGTAVTLFWGSITGGRIAFGQLAHHLRAVAVLRIGLIGAIFGAILFHQTMPLAATFIGASFLGLMLAPVYPTLMSLTPAQVGSRFAAHAVGMQVSACGMGCALVPAAVGYFARRFGIEILPGFLVVGTVLLLAFYNLIDRSVDARRELKFGEMRPA